MDNETGGFIRDTYSKALINTDYDAYEQFKRTREQSMRIKRLEEDMVSMKSNLSDIKNLLQELVSRK